MNGLDSNAGHHRGVFGTAWRLVIPDRPRSAQTTDWWLIHAPQSHPLWSHYVLCCVRLDDAPGFPPAKLRFPGATHEIIVAALDPRHGPYTAEAMPDKQLMWLEPVNVVEQFTATDEEMRHLCSSASWGVVVGALEPESSNGPERVRRQWLTALVKTLAHMRGEEHAP